jgi:hypothetical protein
MHFEIVASKERHFKLIILKILVAPATGICGALTTTIVQTKLVLW